jgi:hypothetical protein
VRPLASAVLAVLVASGCATYVEVPIATPLASKIDVSRFRRLLVAGFITDHEDGGLDLQEETVRLLQNHLKSGRMRVLEPDAPPLQAAVDQALTRAGAAEPGKGETKEQQNEEERVLDDAGMWRRLGEEYQQPLIIAGRIGLESHERAGYEAEKNTIADARGQPYSARRGRYTERMGFTLSADFRFIDGRTGATLHKERFTEEVLYGQDQKVSPLSAYFELMDRLLPNVVGVISTQRIRGTRLLLP